MNTRRKPHNVLLEIRGKWLQALGAQAGGTRVVLVTGDAGAAAAAAPLFLSGGKRVRVCEHLFLAD